MGIRGTKSGADFYPRKPQDWGPFVTKRPEDDKQLLTDAERALLTEGLFFAETDQGIAILQGLKQKYPDAEINYVSLPTSRSIAIESPNRLGRQKK